MDKDRIFIINKNDTVVAINEQNAQLFGLVRDNIDVMWKGGAPDYIRAPQGWQNSVIDMFPIIGGAPNSKVLIDGELWPMGKHGIARDLPWEINLSCDNVIMTQTYEAGKEVKNKDDFVSVFPKSYTMTKTYSVESDGTLAYRLTIEALSDNLPYAVGWHPAFRTLNGSEIDVLYPQKIVTVLAEDIRKKERNVVVFENANKVVLRNRSKNDGFNLLLRHNFGHTMVWDRKEGFIGLEPISAKPLSSMANNGHAELASYPGYRKLMRGEKDSFVAKIRIMA